jgi:hypothetical protein
MDWMYPDQGRKKGFCGHGNSQCTSDLISQIGASINFDLTNELKHLLKYRVFSYSMQWTKPKKSPRIICEISSGKQYFAGNFELKLS